MTQNFELLETAQIELMHQQAHDKINGGEDCLAFRDQHDSLAAELIKRGVQHDTAIVCSEPITDAPNYQRGFTDDICKHCAFGQLFPHCNLYNFQYVKDFECDSFRYYEVLELEPPHGFLMTNGKQTALASPDKIDIDKAALIVSNGEAFGIAEFEQPAQVSVKDFDGEEWQKQHRITQRERRQWWPDATAFYVYRLKAWHPYDGVKLFEDGQIIDEPKLSARQWKIVSKSKDLPKQIILNDEAVSITDRNEFIICDSVKCQRLSDILAATYETEVKAAKSAKEIISVYSLALVRNPRMRVSKKNITAEAVKEEIKPEAKQEGKNMPFGIELREGEYCVINTDTDEEMGCHETEAEADAQLAALRINVEAEEDESAVHDTPKKKPKPKKKPRHPKKDFTDSTIDEIINISVKENDPTESEKQQALDVPKEKKNFLSGLRGMYKSIAEFLNIIDSNEPGDKPDDTKLFAESAGIAQKLVDGELWHFTWSTNAFEDRDGEIFSTKALEEYVVANEKNKDRGYFNLWHINEEDGNFNSDFAKKKWQGVIGRFLVESGPYLRNEKGRGARKFFKKFYAGHPKIAPEGWGCSPEYKYLPEERATGVYENIWITRTSTLGRMAAANIWTQTRQAKIRGEKMALSEDQRTAAIAMWGEEAVTNMLKDGQSRTSELEKAGVAHKGATDGETEAAQVTEVTEVETEVVEEVAQESAQEIPAETEGKQPAGPTEVTMTSDQFETLADAVAGRFQINNESFVEAMGVMAQSLQDVGNRVAELESKGKAKDKAETPRIVFELQKRASENDETVVTDDDDLKGKKPVEASAPKGPSTPESFFATS